MTAVDPWYAVIVRPRRWLDQALLAFSIFAALNVALPLLGIPPILALEGAAALTAVAMMPVFRERGALTWRQAYARSTVLAVAAMAVVWVGRAAVPPVPLFVARATAARGVTMLEPVEPMDSPIPASTVVGWGGIAAYTAVYAPAGLRQPIEHVWWKDGRLVGACRSRRCGAAQGGLQDLLAEDRPQAALRRALPSGRGDGLGTVDRTAALQDRPVAPHLRSPSPSPQKVPSPYRPLPQSGEGTWRHPLSPAWAEGT